MSHCFTLPVELCSGRPNCGATQSFGEKLCLGSSCDCSSSCERAQGSSFFLACSLSCTQRLLLAAHHSSKRSHHPPTCGFLLAPPRKVERLFLELSPSHNIHFLHVTRGGRIAWGSVGTWRVFSMPNGPRLCLRSFSCCLGARLRDLTFDVDPHDPSRMVDGTGRVLYYEGNLRINTQYSTRIAAFKPSRQRTMNGLSLESLSL